MLSVGDFSEFLFEVYGYRPFPWQQRLLEQIVRDGHWPKVIDLPTGSGKTATIDIAIFHLALEAGKRESRLAPVRVVFVVDRRLIVDDAFGRARKLERALSTPSGPITKKVAQRLAKLSCNGTPLSAYRLRGGIPREEDWARTPSQPIVICSTVDQIGSRLLFRGYGVSNTMKPVHAGLIGSDCLILLDEAHLAEPFRQTLDWVHVYHGDKWRETHVTSPWGFALLTATPGKDLQRNAFTLDEEDRADPILSRRMKASKPARLVSLPLDGKKENTKVEVEKEFTKQIYLALDHFQRKENGVATPAIAVVVNTVSKARVLFEQIQKDMSEKSDCILLIGAARPVDREGLEQRLDPIRTGASRTLEKPFILVATQCVEAGVDIDLDALITENAPLDSLRQRFGRLNRDGRPIMPYAAILGSSGKDLVYGEASCHAWKALLQVAHDHGIDIIEFGVDAFRVPMKNEALTRKEDAPVLLPAHLDLLSQTSPIPSPDPEISLYLHGANQEPDSISVIWRSDIDISFEEKQIRRLFMLVPPRAAEAIELPLWAVRCWLEGNRQSASDLGDVAGNQLLEERRTGNENRVFRWRGDDEESKWIFPREICPGDTIVVPASYGGVDEFGWNPMRTVPATDVAQKAANAFATRQFAVRVAPGLLGESVDSEDLAAALARSPFQQPWELLNAVRGLDLPEDLAKALDALTHAKKRNLAAYLDLYGEDEESRYRGVVFVAPFGIESEAREEGGFTATENDFVGSLPGFPIPLEIHSADVERKAEEFAIAVGLSEERIVDLKLAGFLHDLGKVDHRFQQWLHYGDPLGVDQENGQSVLAKSGYPMLMALRTKVYLPAHWRHEALSVRIAVETKRFAEAKDPELVLWLIGTHHGYGRPFYPHRDEEDNKLRQLPNIMGLPPKLEPGAGPQSLGFDWNGLDWSMLFERLKARYGIWELARMEAILRLADHRASEEEAGREIK